MLHTDDKNFENRLGRGKRKISLFMAQEMLYDYSQGRLDQDRRAALEAELKLNEELQSELAAIIAAEKYAGNLALTKISRVHVDELKKIRPFDQIVIAKMKWGNWPDIMRWTAEALLVSLAVAVVASLLPWDKIRFAEPTLKTEVMLAEIKNKTPEPTAASAPVTPTAAKAPVSAVTSTAAAKAPVVAVPVVITPVANAPVITPAASAPVAMATAHANKVAAMKGLLINFMMRIESSNLVAGEIRDKILQVGGVKAGQVELGWRKNNPEGNYYHFIIPESGYQELETALGKYGELRIYKNPHERVMPQGKLRIILWIEDRPAEPKE